MSLYDYEAGRMTTGLLADACYFMTHSETTGRALVPDRVLGFCLAGALIAELLDSRRIVIRGDNLAATPAALRPMDDVFLQKVSDEIARESVRPVRDWLDMLSLTALDTVTRRMNSSHLLYFDRSALRRMLGLNGWRPLSASSAGIVMSLLTSAIQRGDEDENIAMLFGLARAVQLSHPMFYDMRHLLQDPEASSEILAKLGPHHRTLLAHVEAAVNSAVLSHRL